MESFPASDGQPIHVAVSGIGPPIVLLHEWASNHRVWRQSVTRLESRHTLYRWDARGHAGRSTLDPHTTTVTRMASDLADLLNHFALSRPIIVGHSMGALVAWEYVAHHGCDRLGGLCVLDQSPRLVTDEAWHLGIYYDWPVERNVRFMAAARTDFVETVLRLVAEGRNQQARERYLAADDSFSRLRAYLSLLDAGPLVRIWASLTEADWRPVLSRITIPTLLIYGSESNYYGVETGVYVAEQIPCARLIVYDGADHSPHLAEPDRFASDLAAFAARLRP